MASILIKWYRYNNSGWINVNNYLREIKHHNARDWPLLRYWSLIEESPEEPATGVKNIGIWRLTSEGRDFILNQIKVSKRIMLYDNNFRGYDGEKINIINALGDHFNYYELMNN